MFDVRNSFFFMTPGEISSNADMPDEVRRDASFGKVTPLVSWLESQAFSSDAQATFDYMRASVLETAGLRDQADAKFCLNRWDAGWYQIRMGLLWEKGAKKRAKGLVGGYRDFKREQAKLRHRLQDGLYDFGVLPKERYKCN